MEKNIPTKKIKIGEREIEVYEYLTQSEENKRLDIMSGGRDIPVTPGEKIVFTTTINAMNESRLYLVECFCKNFTKEEFDVLPPAERQELLAELEKLVNSEKKVLSPKENL